MKATAKKARKSGRGRASPGRNLPVYLIAAILLLAVAWLAFSIFSGSRPAMQWSSPPAMQIDVNRSYLATLDTERGPVVIELLPQAAPITGSPPI
jgi:hypothetical protein